jgi:hypothetical protein
VDVGDRETETGSDAQTAHARLLGGSYVLVETLAAHGEEGLYLWHVNAVLLDAQTCTVRP